LRGIRAYDELQIVVTEVRQVKQTVTVGYFKIDLQKAGCGDMDLVDLALGSDMWQALVNAVMNF